MKATAKKAEQIESTDAPNVERVTSKTEPVSVVDESLFNRLVTEISDRTAEKVLARSFGLIRPEERQQQSKSEQPTEQASVVMNDDSEEDIKPRRGPGRPKGSKNQAKTSQQPQQQKQTTGKRMSQIPDKLFRDAVRNAESIQDVVKSIPELKALSFDRARQYVVSHAAYLRKQGIRLKYFPRGRNANA